MARLLPLLMFASLMLAEPVGAQTREEKVRNDRKKVEATGYWIYNDLPAAFAEARKTGKPIVVVLRCIPCEECVKLDDEIINADERIKPLLEKFVRVRVVSTNGLDLKTFQFDTDQSFAVFLLNADETIYGRFGTRSHRKEWVGDVSVDGLVKALQGALKLHAAYPANRESLALKRGPAPKYARPELLPTLKGRYQSTIDYKGKVVPSCIHCHQVGEALRATVGRDGLTDEVLFPYPHPRTIGLTLDPKEMSTVSKVAPGSDAERAGFQAGDVITRLGGQPLLSIADVQWVLHRIGAEGGQVPAEVTRDGKTVKLTLRLPAGWRQRDEIAWRASTWMLRRNALGGMFLVPHEGPGLLVQHVGQYAPHDVAHRAGIRKGDVVLDFDGVEAKRETDLIVYSLRKKKPGDRVGVTVLRQGARQTLTLRLPE
ncbi:MAG: Trx7/PDZ domain-containing (seleno)protein [Gemmataceae bacterium]